MNPDNRDRTRTVAAEIVARLRARVPARMSDAEYDAVYDHDLGVEIARVMPPPADPCVHDLLAITGLLSACVIEAIAPQVLLPLGTPRREEP